MPRPWFSLGLVFVAVVLGSLGDLTAQQPSKDEQLLLQIERDWCAANVSGDASVLGRILADDYVGVSSRGVSSTKAEELASLKVPDPTAACSQSNLRARVYGDSAVVTGVSIRAGTYRGVPFKDRQVVWTDTFVRRDGRWQCVAEP